MRRLFQTLSPGRLQIREDSGALAIFGIPFLAGGIGLVLISVGVVPMSNAGDVEWYLWPVMLLMGLAITTVGAALVFGRAWITVDTVQRLVIKEWGLLRPMRTRTHRLDDYTAVRLEFERGDSDSADTFPVVLKARSGAHLRLCAPVHYADARECAIELARHLRVDLEDVSTDHATRVSPDQADRPLQFAGRGDRADDSHAARPAEARSSVVKEAGTTRIVIPVPRSHPMEYILVLVPIVFTALIVAPLSEFFDRSQTPAPVGWMFLGFLVICFGVLPAITLLGGFRRSRRGATIVTASKDGVRVQQRGPWKTRDVASLAASEILDVDFSTRSSLSAVAREAAVQKALELQGSGAGTPRIGRRTERLIAALSRFGTGSGVIVKARKGLTTFGEGLADDEIEYLAAVVRRAVAGSSG